MGSTASHIFRDEDIQFMRLFKQAESQKRDLKQKRRVKRIPTNANRRGFCVFDAAQIHADSSNDESEGSDDFIEKPIQLKQRTFRKNKIENLVQESKQTSFAPNLNKTKKRQNIEILRESSRKASREKINEKERMISTTNNEIIASSSSKISNSSQKIDELESKSPLEEVEKDVEDCPAPDKESRKVKESEAQLQKSEATLRKEAAAIIKAKLERQRAEDKKSGKTSPSNELLGKGINILAKFEIKDKQVLAEMNYKRNVRGNEESFTSNLTPLEFVTLFNTGIDKDRNGNPEASNFIRMLPNFMNRFEGRLNLNGLNISMDRDANQKIKVKDFKINSNDVVFYLSSKRFKEIHVHRSISKFQIKGKSEFGSEDTKWIAITGEKEKISQIKILTSERKKGMILVSVPL